MPHGSVARRAVLGLVAVLSILAPAAGCQRLSVARNDASTLPPLSPTPGRAAEARNPAPAPTAGTPVANRPEPQATPAASPPVAPPTGPSGTSSPTPLLDAALARAVMREPVELPPAEAEGSIEEKPAPATKPGEKVEPNPLPVAPDVLPPLAPPPRPIDAPGATEVLKASATSALDQSKEKVASPARPINPDRPPDPSVSWREGLERLKRLAREQAAVPGDSIGSWRLRVRLLDWLDEPGTEDDSGTLWRTVVAALAESEAAQERTRAADIRRVVRAVEDQAPLEITDLRLCRKVNGFGSFEPIDPSACRPGQAVIVYCEMSGLRYEEAGEMFRSRLSTQVEIVPSPGGEPVSKEVLGTADDLCRRRRRDYYVCYRFNLPEKLAPGSYELRMTQDDLLAGRSTRFAIPMTVQP